MGVKRADSGETARYLKHTASIKVIHMIWTPHGTHNPIVGRRIPRLESIKRAERITRRAVAQSGLRPGVYTNRRQINYESLEAVQSHLLKQIEHDIADFDVLALCNQLYVWHETLVAQNEVLAGEPAMIIQAIRSLIELAVKSCGATGNPLDRRALDDMLALACKAIAWDQIWDQITSGMISSEVVVHEDSIVMPSPNPIGEKIIAISEQYLSSRLRISEMEQSEQLSPPITINARVSLASYVSALGFSDLDICLSEETGYSMVDYFLFVKMATDICLDSGFPVCGVDMQQFMLNCSGIHQVESFSFSEILKDFALSADTLHNVSTRDIFTIGRRNRDSRFLRRPIVLIEYSGDHALLFGFKTLIDATELFRRQIMFGRIPVDSWKTKASIQKVFGRIQGSLGKIFEDAIARDCEAILGKNSVFTRKKSISGVKSNPELGDVDVFLIDAIQRRFILVEVKNSANPGYSQLAMKDEHQTFLDGYLPKLRRKGDWYRSHISELNREYRIPSDHEYRIEEVIVVNQQRLWVLADSDRLPILDDDEFLAKLGRGEELLSDPVVA